MTELLKNCQLEWDKSRGVLYVHDRDTGATVLRLCRLSKEPGLGDLKEGQIDITGPFPLASYPRSK